MNSFLFTLVLILSVAFSDVLSSLSLECGLYSSLLLLGALVQGPSGSSSPSGANFF